MIYPRATGYVRKWHVDIGDKVTEGQLLAEIDTPELDAQLAQARAQLAQAQAAVEQANAQRDYSKANAARYESLAEQKLVSQGAASSRRRRRPRPTRRASAPPQANVAAQEANVRRLIELQAFAKVTAPFAGTITARIDRARRARRRRPPHDAAVHARRDRSGARVRRGAADASRRASAPAPPRTITVREYRRPHVRRQGRALRRRARSRRCTRCTTEIRVPNPDGALLPGMYVQVALDAARAAPGRRDPRDRAVQRRAGPARRRSSTRSTTSSYVADHDRARHRRDAADRDRPHRRRADRQDRRADAVRRRPRRSRQVAARPCARSMTSSLPTPT